ncbi:hypothetical protein AAMO2058_001091300 [Amorphochlora amoebiformis]
MGNSNANSASSNRYKREVLKLSWNILLSLDHKEGLLDTTVADRKSAGGSRTNSRTIALDDGVGFAQSRASTPVEAKKSWSSTHVSPPISPTRAVRMSNQRRHNKVSNASLFHQTFKEYLFQFCPDLESRFPTSIVLVIKMMKTFIQKIIWGKCTKKLVISFTESHAKYNLKKEHFDGFAEAIATTVATMLGKFATFELCKIWREESIGFVNMLHKVYTAYLKRNKKAKSSKDLLEAENMGPSYIRLLSSLALLMSPKLVDSFLAGASQPRKGTSKLHRRQPRHRARADSDFGDLEESMPAVDRSKLFMKMMSDAYNSHGIWDKISMVFTMFGMVSSVVIPQVLFDFVGLGTKSSRNYDVEKVTENIWKVKYWGNQSSCIIIKGADGSLLMSSCPEAQDHTIEQVAKLGPVGAIMIPNMGHDSYAHQWKEKYPDAKVYCPEADVKEMEKGVAIEGSIEGSLPALGNWGVKEVISDDGNFRFSLPLIRIQTQIADRKINALMVTCGVCNWPKTIFSPRYWFFGLVGEYMCIDIEIFMLHLYV